MAASADCRVSADGACGACVKRWRDGSAPRLPPSRRSDPRCPSQSFWTSTGEYRDKAAKGLLIRIAPHHRNPARAAWLPVLRTVRSGRQYTAMFSNTARAHHVGATHDWVVLYVDDGRSEREATVVTETYGPLAGLRVVRGREDACGAYYRPEPELPLAAGSGAQR